jgi:hypothetical protein
MVRFSLQSKDKRPTFIAHGSFSKIMTLMAIVLSWAINKSLCWALLHAVFGGFYVVYWLIVHAGFSNYIAERFV